MVNDKIWGSLPIGKITTGKRDFYNIVVKGANSVVNVVLPIAG